MSRIWVINHDILSDVPLLKNHVVDPRSTPAIRPRHSLFSLSLMAFAKDYAAEITLGYYCLNLVFTLVFFIVGAVFLRHRDKRDQQRREWRQFAERIYSEYSKLKDNDIPR